MTEPRNPITRRRLEAAGELAPMKPRDTSKDHVDNAAMFLMGGPAAIVAQEAQGQRELVASTSLPSANQHRAEWEALGFTFGEPFADDPMFCPATLPDGWTKRRTDHAMWSDLVDAAGNKRGSFFYKAAFYDRSAHMSAPLRRYTIRKDYDRIEAAKYQIAAARAIDTITGERIFASGEHDRSRDLSWGDQEAADQAAFDEVRSWLDEQFPDHEDPAAYWPT